MFKRDILFVCNTVFQCMTAITLKHKEFEHDNVDIIISDHMNESYDLYKRIEGINLFREVFYVETKEYAYYKENIPNNFWEKLRDEAFPHFGKFQITNRYDIFMIYNVDRFAQTLFSILAKKNKFIEVKLYDEGFSTYTTIYKEFINSISNISKKKNILRFFTKRRYLHENITGLYLFEPDLICWDCPYPVHKIVKADINDVEYKNILNNVFGYENIRDTYDARVIFFEEAFSHENIDIGDIELVETLGEIVGKENIFIKIHPRNPNNRFKKLGYKTNLDTGIPWEIIALNNDFSDRVFVTISSSAVLTPRTIFGQNTKTFFLYKCLEKKSPYINDSTEQYFKRFSEKFGDDFYIVNEIEQFKLNL